MGLHINSPMQAGVQWYPSASYVHMYPQMVSYQPVPTQYVEYSPGIMYPVGVAPSYYSQQPTVSLTTPNMADVVDKLLIDFDASIEDQSSCRFLQKQLEDLSVTGDTSIIGKVYDKVLIKIDKYMCLPFGNYLCQKLFELLAEEQLYIILKRIKQDIISISGNLHGTRSVQQLMKIALKNSHLTDSLVEVLKGTVCDMIIVILAIL